MAKPLERLGLYLAHPFTGHTQFLSHLLEGVRFAIRQPMAQLQNAHLTRRETPKSASLKRARR